VEFFTGVDLATTAALWVCAGTQRRGKDYAAVGVLAGVEHPSVGLEPGHGFDNRIFPQEHDTWMTRDCVGEHPARRADSAADPWSAGAFMFTVSSLTVGRPLSGGEKPAGRSPVWCSTAMVFACVTSRRTISIRVAEQVLTRLRIYAGAVVLGHPRSMGA